MGGSISFPGGKFEKGLDQSLRDTALRETYEELALSPNRVNVWGSLPGIGIPKNPYQKIQTGAMCVTGFVGEITDSNFSQSTQSW